MNETRSTNPADIHALAEQAGNAARLLKLLANERRLLVLCELAGAEMTVGDLAVAVGLSQSALSQHLSRMRESGLVDYRREAQTLHYSIADPNVAQILATLRDIYCGPDKNEEG